MLVVLQNKRPEITKLLLHFYELIFFAVLLMLINPHAASKCSGAMNARIPILLAVWAAGACDFNSYCAF
jgi:flagellar biosynthesis regulator FlbT